MMAIGGELHSDEEAMLLDQGSVSETAVDRDHDPGERTCSVRLKMDVLR